VCARGTHPTLQRTAFLKTNLKLQQPNLPMVELRIPTLTVLGFRPTEELFGRPIFLPVFRLGFAELESWLVVGHHRLKEFSRGRHDVCSDILILKVSTVGDTVPFLVDVLPIVLQRRE